MFPVIYPNETKTNAHRETCKQLSTATLFIITKIWKQPQCPSVGEWINCSTARQWNIIGVKKKMNSKFMERYGGNTK